jgi:hypothetical protein
MVAVSAASPRLDRTPVGDGVAFALKDILHLAQHQHGGIGHGVGHAHGGVDQRRDIQIGGVGVVMEVGIHGGMGLFQAADADGAAAAQEREVGAPVKLDGFVVAGWWCSIHDGRLWLPPWKPSLVMIFAALLCHKAGLHHSGTSRQLRLPGRALTGK